MYRHLLLPLDDSPLAVDTVRKGVALARTLGARVTFFAGLGVFTLASVAAGLAQNQEMLIGARAVQGIGAALLTPSALALITVKLSHLLNGPRESNS